MQKKLPLAPWVDCHAKIKPWVLDLPRLLAAKSQWNIYLKIALTMACQSHSIDNLSGAKLNSQLLNFQVAFPRIQIRKLTTY